MYFHDHPGAVLGASIDKYIYTIALPMADFAEHRYRITYRIVEGVDGSKTSSTMWYAPRCLTCVMTSR